MKEDIVRDEVFDAIIKDIVRTMPDRIYEFYKNLPGRNPSETSKNISTTIMSIEESCAVELIRDIVDTSIFSMLALMDAKFKDKNIKTIFERQEQRYESDDRAEQYRMRVDPGGSEYIV